MWAWRWAVKKAVLTAGPMATMMVDCLADSTVGLMVGHSVDSTADWKAVPMVGLRAANWEQMSVVGTDCCLVVQTDVHPAALKVE